MAHGMTCTSVSQAFKIGLSTVSEIIPETCKAIYTVLKPDFLKTPSTEAEWKKIVDDFWEKWDFPHCLGAIDGKHVRIRAPPNSGSFCYNYKGTFSHVLLAVCNACVTFMDMGSYGRAGDSGNLLKLHFTMTVMLLKKCSYILFERTCQLEPKHVQLRNCIYV